tara:strand:- start:23 stop:211 length:189 start_codon:yes stop_codon:yes gene_type:complete
MPVVVEVEQTLLNQVDLEELVVVVQVDQVLLLEQLILVVEVGVEQHLVDQQEVLAEQVVQES